MYHYLFDRKINKQTYSQPFNMSTIRILKTYAKALEVELNRRFPRVERVAPLVKNALDCVTKGKPSEKKLEDSGMLEQFVYAANICRRRRQLDQEKWDDIMVSVKDFLNSIHKGFEKFHPNWNDGDVYIEWTALNKSLYDSDVEDESDCGDSKQEISREFELEYDQTSEREHCHRAVEEYELFVEWLCQTNRRNVYKEFHDHILQLREDDAYAHTPVHFPGVLDTKRL